MPEVYRVVGAPLSVTWHNPLRTTSPDIHHTHPTVPRSLFPVSVTAV